MSWLRVVRNLPRLRRAYPCTSFFHDPSFRRGHPMCLSPCPSPPPINEYGPCTVLRRGPRAQSLSTAVVPDAVSPCPAARRPVMSPQSRASALAVRPSRAVSLFSRCLAEVGRWDIVVVLGYHTQSARFTRLRFLII